eukprot:359306-Chlamydomonas_euryale.AAC.2
MRCTQARRKSPPPRGRMSCAGRSGPGKPLGWLVALSLVGWPSKGRPGGVVDGHHFHASLAWA